MGRARKPAELLKGGGIKRRRYTVIEKLKLCNQVEMRTKEGVSIRKASEEIGVNHSLVLRWRESVAKLREESVPTKKRVGNKVAPAYQLRHIEKDLLVYFARERKLAYGVSPLSLAIEAASLCAKFRRRTRKAQLQSMRRFARRHDLVMQRRSRLIAKCPNELATTCSKYLEYIRPMLRGPNRHPDFIINMDETGVVFDSSPTCTFEKKGASTITIRSTGAEKKRATVSIAITASGKVLKPHLVYKGKPGGRIEYKELPKHPKGAVYSSQKNAWMDEVVFYEWIDEVLVPHIETAPEGVEPLLIMDGCQVHRKKNVLERLQELGVRVELLPPGCTGILQPVDVGINKPFKAVFRSQWDEWIHKTKFKKKVSRIDVSKWVLCAISKLTKKIVKNAWRHREYNWFLEEVKETETDKEFFWEEWILGDTGGGGVSRTERWSNLNPDDDDPMGV